LRDTCNCIYNLLPFVESQRDPREQKKFPTAGRPGCTALQTQTPEMQKKKKKSKFYTVQTPRSEISSGRPARSPPKVMYEIEFDTVRTPFPC
jgi:hypothetical protein